jgi:hypothetical protein
VTDPHPVVLQLEITDAGELIAGRVTTPSGFDRAFTGWLELAAAIETAMSLGKGLPEML